MPDLSEVHDYRYGELDWRSEVEETFRVVKDVRNQYVQSEGRLSATRETTTEYADATATPPTDPAASPPYLFADGSYRRDPAYTFQVTLIRQVAYQPQGLNSYQTTTTTFEPLSGEPASTEVSVSSGQVPMAPTINTALSTLVVQPVVATLTDDCLDEFVSSKKALNLQWAETEDDFTRQARRAMQRDSAIVRTIRMATNPRIGSGDTVRLVIPTRGIDALGLVIGRLITNNLETGDSTMALTLEFWIR
jgi:hypothetical protein